MISNLGHLLYFEIFGKLCVRELEDRLIFLHDFLHNFSENLEKKSPESSLHKKLKKKFQRS